MLSILMIQNMSFSSEIPFNRWIILLTNFFIRVVFSWIKKGIVRLAFKASRTILKFNFVAQVGDHNSCFPFLHCM